jgi:hypothetical protein
MELALLLENPGLRPGLVWGGPLALQGAVQGSWAVQDSRVVRDSRAVRDLWIQSAWRFALRSRRQECRRSLGASRFEPKPRWVERFFWGGIAKDFGGGVTLGGEDVR